MYYTYIYINIYVTVKLLNQIVYEIAKMCKYNVYKLYLN